MIGNPILSQIEHLQVLFQVFLPFGRSHRPDLHIAWLRQEQLPAFVQKSPVAKRYLELLGPLGWDHLPERNLRRNWGQTTIPFASFIEAYLIKLNEGKDSVGNLRLYLTENPELIWLLGFPLAVSNPARLGLDISASLPTTPTYNHYHGKSQRTVLQFLLADSVRLIREELVQLGVNKPSVITCAAQLLKVLGVDGLTEGSFMPPSTSRSRGADRGVYLVGYEAHSGLGEGKQPQSVCRRPLR